MFEDLINNIKERENFDNNTIHNLRQIARYYHNITEETFGVLKVLKGKYNFENRHNIFPNPSFDTHLVFFRGSCDYNVSVWLQDKTGISDFDQELGVIIPAWPYQNYIEEASDIELEKYFRIADNIFYSWMSFIWQAIDGYETRLSAKIIENNRQSVFYLNDFAWYDLSKYISFKENIEPRYKYFQRDLELEEIYSRTDLKFNFLKIPEYDRCFLKNGKSRTISLKQGRVLVDNIPVQDKLPISLNGYLEIKNRQIQYVESLNKALNADWIDVTYHKSCEESTAYNISYPPAGL